VKGSIMPPFPWIVENPRELDSLVAYIQTLGRAKNWRPDNDYEK
jgi:cbb3-type cytochrome oxidase cytochrome c subunit